MSDERSAADDPWPDLDVSRWADTKRSLHLYAQMLGKMLVALAPAQPNWVFTGLQLDARGFTTGAIPFGETSVQGSLDVFASEIVLERSTGASRRIGLEPMRTIAGVYDDVQRALGELGVGRIVSPRPQEVPDTTPFPDDARPAPFASHAVRDWFRSATAVAGIFERWRSHFFGRSAVRLWWGGFDVGVTLFNGKHAPAPADRGYIMKYDLDAQLMNAGLYYGDAATPPFFYGYIYPEPANAAALPIAPAGATWSPALREWVLPYAAVRDASDPEAAVRAFLDAVFALCFSAAGWDRDAFTYVAPKRAAR